MKKVYSYRDNPNETDQQAEQEIEALNQWWSDRFQELKAENDNLKAKLANRDLNLRHLNATLDRIQMIAGGEE